MNVVTRLLRKNVSPGQTIGYALANFTGLAIVLTALLFYRDMGSAVSGDDSLVGDDYLILSKRVEGLGSLGGDKAEFTAADVADMEAQPWCADIGAFTAADFDVFATVDFGGRRMSTSLFLEAIPDRFFDVTPRGWGYSPREGEPLPEVPVVLSRDYLALYNFGYAQARGLPQVSEAMVAMVPLRLSLSGNGRQDYVDARIVGFSNRLNTIAVPQAFIDFANERYSTERRNPSRLIVRLADAGSPEATRYIADHGYETGGDRLDNGRMAYFLRTVTAVVAGVGAVISALAFFILLLSLWLLLHKNSEKLSQLMLLGYTPAAVARPYCRLVAVVNAAVGLLAFGAAMGARMLWKAPLAELGLEGSNPWTVAAIALAIVAVLSAGSIAAIRRHISRTFA